MNDVSQNALAIFRCEKILTLDRLASLLHSSTRTAQRRLKQWHAYRSYNKNGRYYALARSANFDASGIWTYHGILFSQHGNLRETLEYFLDNADAGLSATELTHLLGIPAYSFLSRYNQRWALPKEKYQGVYIYFSKDPCLFAQQRCNREARVRSQATAHLPCDAHSIVILSELITHPEVCVEELVRRVRRKGVSVGIHAVRNLLLHHEIVKKTVDFQSSGPYVVMSQRSDNV